ncbi:hypothetical protein [Xenorhabdus lircayensis]|uniref:Aldehyde dehydrogenase n=1 Tax=Xenorhabdus lircayensis TaxID=2763499 RepID=A0ABS0U0F8_9GAMM|nr:hypothetical protein [Xenorhabdus lircayensis]MBI6547361.1 hypothetical protein [Xenorhabdus lircayensis]
MEIITHLINGEMTIAGGKTAAVFNPSTGDMIHQTPFNFPAMVTRISKQ